MIPQPGQSELLLQGQVLHLAPLLPAVVLSPDCEAPLKKEGGLPEGPVLEALLCPETGEKKIELKEEEAIMDCQVGLPTPTHPGLCCPRNSASWPPDSLGPVSILSPSLHTSSSFGKTS